MSSEELWSTTTSNNPYNNSHMKNNTENGITEIYFEKGNTYYSKYVITMSHAEKPLYYHYCCMVLQF